MFSRLEYAGCQMYGFLRRRRDWRGRGRGRGERGGVDEANEGFGGKNST